MGTSIVFKNAGVISRRAKDAAGANTKLNRALLGALNIIIKQAKQNHIFKNQSGKLQGSIDAEAKGLTGSVFIPIRGALGVVYAPWIYTGSRKTKSGTTVTWRRGGDPFLHNAAKTKRVEVNKFYKKKVYETYKDLLTRGLK